MENRFSRLWLAAVLAIVFYGIGAFFVVPQWPFLQQAVVPHCPDWLLPVSSQVTFWSLYILYSLVVLGVLPSYNRWRIIGCIFGGIMFLVNLLLQKNVGGVALQSACALLGLWSLWANRAYHEPITATRKQWFNAAVIIFGSWVIGQLVVHWWPVNAHTQYAGAYWGQIALAGALVLFVSIVALETRVLTGESRVYATLFGVGASLLTISYLGQFNASALSLNSSFCLVMYGGPPLLKWMNCRDVTA